MYPAVKLLITEIIKVEENQNTIFLCGNGGSGANSLHIENDWSIGINKLSDLNIRIITLGSNPPVLSCIANDYSYSEIFSKELRMKSRPGDLLITFSGSGNSPNIINAIIEAKKLKVRSCAITGFDGGEAKKIADISINFPVHNMQIVEDIQLILGHLVLTSFGK
jgi:D-sedoheptulose 7-phosphate isomerase